MGIIWGGGRTLCRDDSRTFWSIIINWKHSAFSLVPPPRPPFYRDDLQCFTSVLMMFFYQPCLGWDQVLSCKWTRRPTQEVSADSLSDNPCADESERRGKGGEYAFARRWCCHVFQKEKEQEPEPGLQKEEEPEQRQKEEQEEEQEPREEEDPQPREEEERLAEQGALRALQSSQEPHVRFIYCVCVHQRGAFCPDRRLVIMFLFF